jgi:hypothetical protein
MDHEKFVYEHNGVVARGAVNDRQGEHFVIASEMECDRLIQENRMLAEMQKGAKDECFRLAARVPMPVVERAMIEGWFHDDAKWAQWMNDPQNRDFRVYGGRI